MSPASLDAAIAEALIGIDTLWGGDVMNPSGVGRFIADCWFSDEPLPVAYTHPAAAALRANGGVGAKAPDYASIEAYRSVVDVHGAITCMLDGARAVGGLRGEYLRGPGPLLRGDVGSRNGDRRPGAAGALRALRPHDHRPCARAVPA